MTRKDFELIAKTIANLDEIVDEETLQDIAEAFASALSESNPRFDRHRFVVAATFTDAKREHLNNLLLQNWGK